MFRDKCPLTFYSYIKGSENFMIIRFLWQLSSCEIYACIIHLQNNGKGYYSFRRSAYVIIPFSGVATEEIADCLEEVVVMNNDFSFSSEVIDRLEADGIHIPELNEKAMKKIIDGGNFKFKKLEDVQW